MGQVDKKKDKFLLFWGGRCYPYNRETLIRAEIITCDTVEYS